MGGGGLGRSFITLVAAGAVALLASSAGAAPEAIDLQLDIAVGEGTVAARGTQAPVVPNGTSVTIQGLSFHGGPVVSLINPEPASAKVRFELPPGLSWGPDFPDPAETCTSTPSTAECLTPSLQPVTGQTDWGWGWDLVAAQAGTYVLKAELAEATPADAQPSNNSSSVTVVVTEAPVGGETAVAAGAVKLTPAKPKAGSVVRATVAVTAGGVPVRPTSISCKSLLGSKKLNGTAKTTTGTATCIYRPPASAKGKSLRGTMSFSARGKPFTRRFSAKLR